ncbi:MAG: helix-turn-helix domain-containing protein [Pseudomonadota bacterium]
MRWQDIDQQVCAIARTLSIVGDRWTLLIVRDAFLGTRRFADFQRQLDISRHRLADRLEKLVTAGVMERRPYQERPVRHAYHLTQMGIELYPVMLSLARWGNDWLDDGSGPPVEYVHRACGKIMQAELHCSECEAPLNPHDVIPIIGPGLRTALARRGGTGEAENRLPPTLREELLAERRKDLQGG